VRLQGLSLPALAAAAMLLAAAGPVAAQVVTCAPGVVTTTCTISNTESTHSTDVNLLVVAVVAPGQPVLSSQLQAALAGPNGAAILNALTSLGVLGPATPAAFIGTIFDRSEISITTSLTFGPATILIGPDQSIFFFVPLGTTNTHTNTHSANFFDNIFQASSALSNQGVGFLLGDLHTTFQTTLIDDGFRFMHTLLSQGRENGAVSVLPTPLAYAPEAAASDAANALAYVAGPPPADDRSTGWSAWAKASGSSAAFDSTSSNFGYDVLSAGGEGGVDYRRDAWLFGVAAGIGNSDVTQAVTGDRGDIDSVRLGAYGGYRPGDWSATAAVAIGFHSLAATRLSALPVPATASYDATSLAAGAEAARRYRLWGGGVEPMAGLVYTALHVNSFTETGTTFLDLAGSGETIDALKGYLGARAYRTFAGGAELTPEVRGRLLYDFLDDPRGYTAAFVADPAATPIPVTGIQPDRFGVMLGGGITASLASNWRASFNYDAELRGDDIAHTGSARVKVRW
jgi:outer membrane autotransporter protein